MATSVRTMPCAWRSIWSKKTEAQVRVFLMGDGVMCARKGQKTPDGYYNVERMIRSLALRGKVAI